MYYCNNCDGVFILPRRQFFPYEDYLGEWHTCCPLCNAPENYTEIGRNQSDDQTNEATGQYGTEL